MKVQKNSQDINMPKITFEVTEDQAQSLLNGEDITVNMSGYQGEKKLTPGWPEDAQPTDEMIGAVYIGMGPFHQRGLGDFSGWCKRGFVSANLIWYEDGQSYVSFAGHGKYSMPKQRMHDEYYFFYTPKDGNATLSKGFPRLSDASRAANKHHRELSE